MPRVRLPVPLKRLLLPAVRYARSARDGSSLLALALHYLRALQDDSSYAGEYAYLCRLLARLDIPGGYVVDIAACDGVSQSCTRGFFRQPAWSGLAVEMDPDKFSRLAFSYSNYGNARLARCRVTPHNVVALLQGFEVPQRFTLLNLDIDSYDLYVMESLLRAGFAPTVITMEVNEKIPPPLYFTVDYHPTHYWAGDDFFGCSLTAAAAVVRAHGYVLESLNYNNAIFVRADAAQGRIADQDVASAYDEGYRNRPERKQLFYWNARVEPLLHATPAQAQAFLQDYFRAYEGRYTLRVD